MKDSALMGIRLEIDNYLSCIWSSEEAGERRVHIHALANALQALYLHIDLKSHWPLSIDLIEDLLDDWNGDFSKDAMAGLAREIDEYLGHWLLEKGKIFNCDCGKTVICGDEDREARHRSRLCG